MTITGVREATAPGYVGVGDEFGAVVTTGDLNEDGYDDVIIGVPGETVSSRNDAGAVQILYGSATGSITDGAEMLYVSQSAFTGTSQTNARFGSAITVIGNDLIIRAPGNTVSGITAAGSIYHYTAAIISYRRWQIMSKVYGQLAPIMTNILI